MATIQWKCNPYESFGHLTLIGTNDKLEGQYFKDWTWPYGNEEGELSELRVTAPGKVTGRWKCKTGKASGTISLNVNDDGSLGASVYHTDQNQKGLAESFTGKVVEGQVPAVVKYGRWSDNMLTTLVALGGGASGTLGVWREGSVILPAVDLRDKRIYSVCLKERGGGAGLGGSGGTTIFIATSLLAVCDMVGRTVDSGWGLKLDIGAKWTKVAEAALSAKEKLELLIGLAKIGLAAGKSFEGDIAKVKKVAEEMLRELGKPPDAGTPQFFMYDTPVGGGLHVALVYSKIWVEHAY